ncbi:MAG: FAD-dependent oxidoreductase, partial [Chlamydiota bacterium]|nr:FAD-dependent oxidoreductase [Chlamydiota bacterium]
MMNDSGITNSGQKNPINLNQKHIMIVGGGISGMAAALTLLDAGFRVTLLEKREVLGGRASSIKHPDSKVWVDNCQHILLACCTNLLHFYQSISVSDNIQFHDRIYFMSPGQDPYALSAAHLPAPFHLMKSFLRMPKLNLRDKFVLCKAMLKIFLMNEKKVQSLQHLNTLEWLTQNHQSPNCISYFWEPFLISALNENLEKASAKYMLKAVREAFL